MRSLFSGVLIFFVLISHAFAQGRIPDFSASELQLQQQRERELREQMESVPNVQLDAGEQQEQPNVRLPQTEEPCFDIQTLQLTGELSDRFQWALRAANKDAQGKDDIATNRCLGSEGINIVMGRIQNAIIQRGYVTTRVVAPEQDLASGTLALVVIPGYVHQIRWADEESGKTASWRTALPIREGDLLNLRDLEQGLEMLKRIPTAEADIQIEPGDDPGQSDLVITRSQRFPFRLNLSIDDGGSKSTGRYQGGLTFSYDNWFNFNDLFYISLNHDIGDANGGGSRGHTIHYSVPFRGNWLFSVNGSYYHYDQRVQGINQTYEYSGNSRNFDMSVSRRLWRTSTIRTNVYLKGWTRNSHNYIEDTEIEVQRRRTSGYFSYDVFTGTWLKKPSGFEASKYVAGFNLNLAF